MGNSTSKSTKTSPVALPNGSLYQGELLNSKPHGTGQLKSPSIGVYEGRFVDGLRAGKGKMFYTNGEFYNGEWWIYKA